MTCEGNIHRARVSLQQCGRPSATVDRGERHVAAFIGVSLEPRPYSFISAPNHLAELSSIKAHRVQNELAGHSARIEHDQVSPEVRSLVDDAAFKGMLVDGDEGERTSTSCLNIRKRRRHSEAPSDRNKTQSSVCNLMGKSLTNHQSHQLLCEHFPVWDMSRLCVSTATWAVYALYAATTTGSERQAMIETIPHSVAKLTMAGDSQALTCAGSELRKGPGRQGDHRQLRISGTLLLVPVLLFLGFRARPVARSLGRLPYRAVIGVAWRYGSPAFVRLGELFTLTPGLVVGRLGQVLIRSAQVGHASLSGWAGNARGEGTVRMGSWEYASCTDCACAKGGV